MKEAGIKKLFVLCKCYLISIFTNWVELNNLKLKKNLFSLKTIQGTFYTIKAATKKLIWFNGVKIGILVTEIKAPRNFRILKKDWRIHSEES